MTWQALAAGLADELVAVGKLRSPEWITAFREVPRHAFVPRYLEPDGPGGWTERDIADTGLAGVYANRGLYTLVGPDPHGWGDGPLSSSTTVGLMARMLESLDVRDGQRVLEIGTGTGYNAALLCHRLASEQVHSIDIDPSLVALARGRLASLGYLPVLVTGDGRTGMPGRAPFDRIIATCSVPEVPWAWIEQLTADGVLLVDVQPSIAAGNLVRLHRTATGATGRFEPEWATFMAARAESAPPRVRTSPDLSCAPQRPSAVGFREPWQEPVWWFLASLVLPAGVLFGRIGDDAVFLDASDGSRAEVERSADGAALVREHGPAALWSGVEAAFRFWTGHHRPGWDRLGVTITRGSQVVWLDHETAAVPSRPRQ